MLVLSRGENETLVIGGQRVTIQKVSQEAIKVRIDGADDNSSPQDLKLALNEPHALNEGVRIIYIDSREVGSTRRARIAVDAPAEVPVHRLEVWEAMRRA
jgi:sRNA-binding carbon storage regulator CsrA